ncbi:MAG: leucine-rich repeat domain-containing protein [Lachnospiraceae bacterium]|nr:leucine-rich repeat domain-containing protein [Lachnospiraceae bacterium]
MKKIFYRLGSLCMIACLALPICNHTTGTEILCLAADNIQTGYCGENARWQYNTQTKSLTISGTGKISDNYKFNREIKYLTLEEGITEIGDSVFYNTSIENASFPNSLTKIGYASFWGCENLKSISLPVSLSYIGEVAFEKCTSLTEINVDNDNSVFMSVDGILYSKDGKSLILYPASKEGESFEIPSNTETLGEYAFDFNNKLRKIIIPNSLKDLGSDTPFLEVCHIEDLDVTSDNQYYKSIDGILYNKDMTTLIKYGPGRTQDKFLVPYGVEHIEKMAFKDSSFLKELFVSERVADIGRMALYGCIALEKLTVENPACDIDYSIDTNNLNGKLTIVAYEDSLAYKYVKDKNISCELLPKKEDAIEQKETTVTSEESGQNSTNDNQNSGNTATTNTNEKSTQPDTTKTSNTVTKTKNTETKTESNIFLKKAKIKKTQYSKKKLVIVIKKVKNASGYEVEVAKDKNFKKIIYKRNFKKINATIVSAKIKKKSVYYIRVRAFKKIKQKYYFGKWSAKKSVKHY